MRHRVPAKCHPSPKSDREPIEKLPITRKLLYSSIVLAMCVAPLLAVELSFRLTATPIHPLRLLAVTHDQLSETEPGKEPPIYDADPSLIWKLKPNLRDVYWDFTSVTTNASGYRDETPDRAIAAKSPGTLRIVCLGDSVTFGYRTPLVFPNAPTSIDRNALPYPMLIERHLRTANPGRPIEVVTMAVPGYTSTQGQEWLKREIVHLAPDLVTVSFGYNDSTQTLVPDRDTVAPDVPTQLSRWMIIRSQAFAHFVDWRRTGQQPVRDPSRTLQGRTSHEEYLLNILTITEMVRERRGAVVLIPAPLRDGIGDDPSMLRMKLDRLGLAHLAAELRVPYLDIKELGDAGYPENMKYFGERLHPNYLGHRLLASRLLTIFAENQLLPNVSIPPLVP